MTAPDGRVRERRVSPERRFDLPPRPSDFGLVRGPAAVGVPHTLSGRCHGDPFPLPPLRSCRLASRPGASAPVCRAVARHADGALRALNSLDAPTMPLRSLVPDLTPTLPQLSIIDRVLRRVASFGPPPPIDGRSALADILKSKDIYSGSDVPVRPYNPAKFSVLTSGIEAKPLYDRLPPIGQHFMNHASSLICREPAELERLVDAGNIQPVYPYWDVNLRHRRQLRLDLFRQLMKVGLVGLRLRIKARASLFFVTKKNDQLRLVVDGREASSLHKRPPSIGLGSASAVASVDLSDDALQAASSARQPAQVFGASADLRQGFYQMTWLQMGSWFGFDYVEPASEFPGCPVYDDDTGQFIMVSPETPVYAVYQGLPPGWSWSLFFCNLVTADCLAVGVGRALNLSPDDIPFVEEKKPAPPLSRRLPILSCYVDNGNIVGASKDLVNLSLSGFLSELDRRSLAYHEVTYACENFECGGAVFNFAQRRCSPKPSRVWRLYYATGELLRLRGCTGFAVRTVLGHVVHVFMLLRPALACLDHLYRFVTKHGERFGTFTAEELCEIRTVKGLILLSGVDMGAPWASVAFCSDACLSGYSLAESVVTYNEVSAAASAKERWRFRGTLSRSDQKDILSCNSSLPTAEQATGSSADIGSAFLLADVAEHLGRSSTATRMSTAAMRSASYGPRAFSDVVNLRDDFKALPDSLLSPTRWHNVIKGGFRFDEAIHMLEGRTTLLGLVRMSRSTGFHGSRFLSIGDNLSSLLAFERGRARDWGLRRLTRMSAARQIGCELQQLHRYSESDRNPTDYDSRAVERGDLGVFQVCHGRGVRWTPPRCSACHQADGTKCHAHRSHHPRPTVVLELDKLIPMSCCTTSFPTVQPSAPPPAASAVRRPASRRHVLELYAGCARLSGAALDEGLEVGMPFELSNGEWCNLQSPRS